jgi:hypothetical protein
MLVVYMREGCVKHLWRSIEPIPVVLENQPL